MRYKFAIPTLYFFSSLSLFPEANNIIDIPHEAGEKKAFLIPSKEKKPRFIFKDTPTTNGIDLNNEHSKQKESKKYVYENKSRFKFQFTSGTGYNNLLSGQGKSSASNGNAGKGQGKRIR